MALEGLLGYFPRLRDELDVIHVPFARPRQRLVELLGEDHQGCPVMVLADAGLARENNLPVRNADGVAFIDDEKAIIRYLVMAYSISRPAHD